MPILTLPDASLHYLLEGPANAPVLVLSNSLGTDLHLWAPQIAVLTKHLRVLRYDTRGHGSSITTANACSLADLATDVLHLLDSLSIDRFSICGISLGGITALWLAIHAPHRVLAIMPCNTAARIGTAAGWDQRIAEIASGGMASIADATMQRWFTPDFREAHPTQVETTRKMLVHTDRTGYIACCTALRDADLSAAISSIAACTLIVSGTHDPVTPPSDGLFLQQHIAGASLCELSASHLSNIEAAPTFLSAMLDWMGLEQ